MVEAATRTARSWAPPGRDEIDDAYIGGERTGEGSGRGRRGHTPFIIAVETSKDGRPLYARLQVVRRVSDRAGSNQTDAPVSEQTTSSATAGNGFVALPGSRVSSTSATWHRTPVAPPPDTPLPLGKYRARQRQKQPLGHPPRRRGQTSASLPRRLRLALQSSVCPENHPRATGHRRRGDPANALSPPQTG